MKPLRVGALRSRFECWRIYGEEEREEVRMDNPSNCIVVFAHRHCFKFWLCQSNQLLRLSEGRVGLSCERLPLSRLDMDPAG